MSIEVSIPDKIADELYWLMDELDGRMGSQTRAWFKNSYRPKMRVVWDRLEEKRRNSDAVPVRDVEVMR